MKLAVSLELSLLILIAGYLSVDIRQVSADKFTLHNGGRLSGRVVSDAQETIVLRTVECITLELSQSQIEAATRESETEVEYRRRAPRSADTVEAQWELAEWCRANRLPEQRRVHLLRMIDHDPNHAQARHALGFSFVDGQWRLPEDWQKKDGYVRYRGRWRTVQEIELMKVREQREIAQRQWLARIHRLRKMLESGQASDAREKILAIDDPQAVHALEESLKKERFPVIRLLYVKALAHIGDHDALRALIETSLNDPHAEVFYTCADEIVDRKPLFATEAYIRGLKDANNVRVNRSAQVLARLEAREAIVPLIESLVTVHTVVQPTRGCRSPDAMTTTFVSPGNSAAEALMPSGVSFTAGNRPPAIRVPVQNQAVLAALVQLSGGVSFGFNKQAWTNWDNANRRREVDVEGRRSG